MADRTARKKPKSRLNVLPIRMNAEEREELDQAAQREGLSTGAWLRMLGLRAARGAKE